MYHSHRRNFSNGKCVASIALGRVKKKTTQKPVNKYKNREIRKRKKGRKFSALMHFLALSMLFKVLQMNNSNANFFLIHLLNNACATWLRASWAQCSHYMAFNGIALICEAKRNITNKLLWTSHLMLMPMKNVLSLYTSKDISHNI